MSQLQDIVTLMLVHSLYVMSPGPNFALVSHQTLVKGRTAGLFCALGIALGVPIHLIYASMGIEVLFDNAAQMLKLFQIVAGVFLLYLGCKGLTAGKMIVPNITATPGQCTKPVFRSLMLGFFCNLFNPKAPIYFVALFVLLLSSSMSVFELVVSGAIMMLIHLGWFAIVAVILSCPTVRLVFFSWSKWVNRLFGVIMFSLGSVILNSAINGI